MKTLRNANTLPQSHWTTWNNQPEHYSDDFAHANNVDPKFCFTDHHEFWEHPASSPLAQQSKATLANIDYDSDIFLGNLVSRLWVPDIVHRKDSNTLDTTLVDFATTVYNALTAKEEAYHTYTATMEEHADIIQQEEAAQRPQYEKMSLLDYLQESSATSRRIIEAYIEAEETQEEILNTVLPKFLTTIVATQYEPLPAAAYQYGVQLTYEKDFDTLGEAHFYTNAIQRDLYHLNIATYPSQNLSHYVHDELLYMNYVQNIVVHDNVTEQDIVHSARLLTNDVEKMLPVFTTALQGLHGWWT